MSGVLAPATTLPARVIQTTVHDPPHSVGNCQRACLASLLGCAIDDLPAFERVLHTVLTLLFGVVLMALAPVLIDWLGQPTDVVATEHGAFSALFTVLAAGMIVFGIRDGIAALGHFRPAEWVRDPIVTAETASGRNVLVGGGTGFVGGHVVRALRRRGDAVWVWTRDAGRALERFGPHVHVVTSLAAKDEVTQPR